MALSQLPMGRLLNINMHLPFYVACVCRLTCSMYLWDLSIETNPKEVIDGEASWKLLSGAFSLQTELLYSIVVPKVKRGVSQSDLSSQR